MNFPASSHDFPIMTSQFLMRNFRERPHSPKVKCLEDGTRQMAEDVLLVGSHVASWWEKITGFSLKNVGLEWVLKGETKYWLVVWNMNFIFPYLRNNDPN